MQGFIRPESVVLPEESVVPAPNVVVPPPNVFTHEVIGELPFTYAASEPQRPPDGTLARGSRVVLLRRESGGRCRAIDERGLYVDVDGAGLRPL